MQILNSMTLEERAKSLNVDAIISLLEVEEKFDLAQDEISRLKYQAEGLKIQLGMYQSKFHGSTSEKMEYLPEAFQVPLGVELITPRTPVVADTESPKTEEKKESKNYKKDYPGTPSYSGLRFDEVKVVMEDVIIPAKGIEGLNEDEYVVVRTNLSCKITRQASYKVIRYIQDVIKIKSTNEIVSSHMPDSIFGGSYADTDFIVGMLVDKFKYHLPLYRQQQMIRDAGIYLPRSTLSNWVLRAGELLKPIYDELLKSIKESRVLSMDEVPIRVGSSEGGGVKKNFIWPMYGDKNEVGFVYSDTRGSQHIVDMLGLEHDSEKILLTDGYSAYNAYKKRVKNITQAYCWAHVRRKFVEALKYEEKACSVAILLIAELYGIESEISESKVPLDSKKILKIRQERSKPIADKLFTYLDQQLAEGAFLPSSPFTKACSYAFKLEDGLRLFLGDPEVPIDNNHTERAIRPIVLGRKNWLFCWSELGAETVAIMQSLISSCVLQGINPTQYLKDVFERMSEVKTKDIRTLIPREWAKVYLPQIEEKRI